jgi:hypothetical protein
MKGILMLFAVMIFIPQSAESFYFSFSFGRGGKDVKKEAAYCGPCAETKTPGKPVKTTAKMVRTETKKSQPKTKKVVAQSKPQPKPEYLRKAEKAVKVKKTYKRDWKTLSADGIGAAGITYGARKSNWFIGTGGAVVLLYSLIAERNTNSPLDQTVAVLSGVGLGYLPKIEDDDSSSTKSTTTSLPPPPNP